MLRELLKNPRALFYAVLVHVALIVILVVTIQWHGKPAPLQGSEKIIQAKVIDEAKLQAEKQRKLDEEKRKREAEEAKRRAEAEAKRKAEQAAHRKKQQEAEQRRQAKIKADKEAKERQRIAEQKHQAELEAKRKAEAQRKAEEAKRKAEAQRKADEARRQKENLEMMQQQMAQEEADRKARAEAERRQRELASLRDQYSIAIAQKVERNWIRPPGVEGTSCRVRVKQIPGGDVVSVDASACTGDPSYRKSVEAAVFRAAPLPQPPDPAVFDRDINFNFEPKQ